MCQFYFNLYAYIVYMAHHFILLRVNPFGLGVDREGWWFEHSVLRVCLSAEGAKNVPWPWLSPLRGQGSLTMTSTGKFVYIYIYIYMHAFIWKCQITIYSKRHFLFKISYIQVFSKTLRLLIYIIFIILPGIYSLKISLKCRVSGMQKENKGKFW